jgi:hypothetical protein
MQDFEREPRLSWPVLFLIPGICLLGFCAVLYFLEGEYPPVFVKAGLVLLGMSLLTGCYLILVRQKKARYIHDTDSSATHLLD